MPPELEMIRASADTLACHPLAVSVAFSSTAVS
jgi:hypothetical protein